MSAPRRERRGRQAGPGRDAGAGEGALHRGLVGARELIGTRYLADPDLRAEYQRDIAPRTRAALARVFAELGPRLAGVGRVLDLGAGTGAAGEAARAALGPGVEVVSVDRVAAAPGVVVADLRAQRRPPGVGGRFPLILAAHLLNELGLSVEARAALVLFWARELLAEGGHLVLIEPALRETGRDLLALRDRLGPAGFFVVAPCFWQGPCPALERERDWCHSTAPWEPDEAERRAGRSRVDFAYLVLRYAPGAAAAEAERDRRLFRVVSDPLVEKGRLRLFGCGPSGRHALVRLDRDRSSDNAGFEAAERGDVLVAGPTERAGDGLRVGPTTRVERR